MSPQLSIADLDSIKAGVREEIAATSENVKSALFHIDGIEHLPDVPGGFVYRLILSSPVQFGADQSVTFHTRNPKDTIQTVIIRSDDDGLVVECQKPLPSDAKLLSVSFDPTFILRALEEFILDMAPKSGEITKFVVDKTIPVPGPVQPHSYADLNEEQALAVEEMAATPLHFLWGPPGTGKTTTIGVAIARWLRQKKRVLVVSTSNAAVDVALRATLKNLRPEEKRLVLRLGTSLDPVVQKVTLGGNFLSQNTQQTRVIAKAQRKLQQIRELVQNRSLSHDRLHQLYVEAQPYEQQIEEFNKQTALAAPTLTSDVLVTGCTLAKMVLDAGLRQQPFDVVVLDEASMASMLFALAASSLASEHLVYAGDPKQLPPIVQSKGPNAGRWFGQNVYDWFGVAVGEDVQASRLCLMRTQYRMTNEIGDLVSRLSYGGILKHGRGASGPKVEFIDIEGEWQTTYYSVKERSYYHLAAVPLVYALLSRLRHKELLLLSPFRPQRSLLAALAFDIRQLTVMKLPEKVRELRQGKKWTERVLALKVDVDPTYISKLESGKLDVAKYPSEALTRKLAWKLEANLNDLLFLQKTSASTIHKAQGSEAKAVVVDLTTHSPQHLAAFFRDKHCERLFNVAISRAEDRLVIIGSKSMLQELGTNMPFWKRVLSEFGGGMSETSCADLLGCFTRYDNLSDVPLFGATNLPAIYSHHSSLGSAGPGIRKLKDLVASRKLLVLQDPPAGIGDGDYIVRTDKRCPALFVAGGSVCLPHLGQWISVSSKNVSRVLWRIGFSHLADDEMKGDEAGRFFCPECSNGNLVLHQFKGEGWFLVCTNLQQHTCSHRKHLSLDNAKLKVRLHNMTCPKKHPLTVRQGGSGFFLGCENYPSCDHTESLAILEGM